MAAALGEATGLMASAYTHAHTGTDAVLLLLALLAWQKHSGVKLVKEFVLIGANSCRLGRNKMPGNSTSQPSKEQKHRGICN